MAAAFALLLPGVAAQAETTIRVTLQLPETHPLGVNLSAWKTCVEAETEDLKIQIFPSAQLYKDNQVPEAVGSGAIEMGTASLTRFAGSVPAVDAVYVPFLLDSAEKVGKFTAPGSTARAAIDEAVLRETGARILWWQAFGRTIYLSKDPIRVPADIKGKKVRTFGKLLGWTAEALGAAPTLMSGSKQFLAYQQGAVDVGITGVTAVKSRKLHEVMDHLTLSYDSTIEFVAVMNNDFYEGLSEANRRIIDDCGVKVEKELRDSIFQLEEDALAYVKDKINIIELTDAERAEWRAATVSVVDRFVSEGGETAAKVVEEARKY
ncbi:TRAP transporter substrate-binding protein DctP [Pelagibius litoralis]|uniref:TRAP transporter substrate-binding protein DctP n=2 Tax=Pelagibius litoralis TaxID=374515 RepID=A0A967C4S6_9PROT|nr:TRAP transporter substrate-binding protein DctP [Pelagibius litoralis]